MSIWWCEKWIIRLCEKYNITDIPNDRTLHIKPIARGGGLGIFLVLAIILGLFNLSGWINIPWELAGGSLILFLVSLYEDYDRVPIKIRLPVQVFVSFGIVYSVNTLAYFPFPAPLNFSLGIWGDLLSFLWIMGMTNFFNFMDGIDGLAVSQAIIGGMSLALLGGSWFLIVLGLLIASTSIGFLRWNWQPARIFMGETGAITLGFLFACAPFYLESMNASKGILLFGLIFWFFLADGTFTLIRRMVNGEKIWEPHRSHLYQRLILTGLNHSQVVAGLMVAQAIIAGTGLLAWYQGYSLWFILLLGVILFLIYWIVTLKRERMYLSQI